MAEKGQSTVEGVKRASRHLRGGITEALTSDAPQFSGADATLLKFHGTYQGYDRDSATALKQRGLGKDIEFMVRCKIPGGRLSAKQYLELDALAGRHGGDKLRITTRQGIQFHGIAKSALKATIAEINASLLTTLGACGDVVRNVTATPAPIADAKHRRLQADAAMLSDNLAPTTRAYHEIWIGDERVDGEEPADPLYGEAYLPRKFKIGIATPDDNSIDVLTNDLGIVALFADEVLIGYNLAIGGGLGMTHNKPATYPRLATEVVFVGPDRLLEATRAVIAVWRDHGDRANRKHARIKYLIQEEGAAWFKARLEEILGPLEAPRPAGAFQVVDHMGWHPQGDGKFYYGLPIANGRIHDVGDVSLRAALRRVFTETAATPILMPTQDILLADLAEEDRPRVEAILSEHGVALPGALSPVARWAMACPALPSCGLALNEAERIRLPLIARIEAALNRHGLGETRVSVRITGCPNGCARPYAGDIGIVGRTPNDYAIYLGGDFEGTRLNALTFERVPLEHIADRLEPLFAAFARDGAAGEGFGDFCHRLGSPALRSLAGESIAA